MALDAVVDDGNAEAETDAESESAALAHAAWAHAAAAKRAASAGSETQKAFSLSELPVLDASPAPDGSASICHDDGTCEAHPIILVGDEAIAAAVEIDEEPSPAISPVLTIVREARQPSLEFHKLHPATHCKPLSIDVDAESVESVAPADEPQLVAVASSSSEGNLHGVICLEDTQLTTTVDESIARETQLTIGQDKPRCVKRKATADFFPKQSVTATLQGQDEFTTEFKRRLHFIRELERRRQGEA